MWSIASPNPNDSSLLVIVFTYLETVTPGPGKYDDIVMLAKTGNYVLSQHKGGTKGKFDNEKRETVFEKTHSKDFQVPGPGSYISPS